MSRLGDGLSRLFGRVEILARGGEPFLKAAEIALDKGDALEARAQARTLLSRVPKSPLGLALWADAAEACGFSDEVVEALEKLVEQAPWQQEVWLRLGKAGLACGWEEARGALERAAAGRDAPRVTREALLTLADLDMAEEPARARHWLARVPSHPTVVDAPLALRQAECAMALGQWEEAKPWVTRMEELGQEQRDELGGRLRLVQARAARRWPDEWVGRDPVRLAISAFVLGTPGAEPVLVQLIAQTDDAALIARARDTVAALGAIDEPRWKAAFALAEGRQDDARVALVEAARAGDRAAAASLVSHAVRWRDVKAVSAVAEEALALLPEDVALLWKAEQAVEHDEQEDALRLLDQAWQLGGEAETWAAERMKALLDAWLATPMPAAAWDRVWRELRRVANAAEAHHLHARLEALALERDRPLYVAILGEFNAGKSTLINALLATDVAPTGIRPTTATLHWVAWAPDPFARIVLRAGPDRVVMHDDLKATLEAVRDEGDAVERVFIYAPVERLKRIEILDTPGFNAPDTSHAEEARRGIEEAHVALWLLDATAPLKESERQVIERVAAAGVPLQVLVNKCDRLGDADLKKVMAYIQRSLHETGIASLQPPVAMSAQLALKGRLGDAEALSRSGWPEVETLLADHIVNVSDHLRERALRRKSARIAHELAAIVSERCREEQDREHQAVELAQARDHLASQLRAEQSATAEAIVEALEPTLHQLERDMTPIGQLAEERRGDPEVRGYVVEQTTERLTAGFVRGLRDVLNIQDDEASFDARIVSRTARGVFAGAAAAFVGRPPLRGDALVAAVNVAVALTADAIESHGDAGATDRSQLASALRVRALAAALESP